jgi:hypothetical protein
MRILTPESRVILVGASLPDLNSDSDCRSVANKVNPEREVFGFSHGSKHRENN